MISVDYFLLNLQGNVIKPWHILAPLRGFAKCLYHLYHDNSWQITTISIVCQYSVQYNLGLVCNFRGGNL